MKRLKRLATAVLMGVALTIGTVVPANAEVVTNISVPINVLVFVPCANGGAGELVSLSGNLHVLVTVTEDEAGGFHLSASNNPQGISGTGLTTGANYRGTGVTRQELNLTNGASEVTFVNNFRIIGQGTGNNFLVHQTVHLTVNANGEVTADVVIDSVDCK
ncbi:MAG: hypothetical protein HYX84_06145 [Chloroflexi bacterium]|nr:hypothetical protein [Chloroflexota bacterium]